MKLTPGLVHDTSHWRLSLMFEQAAIEAVLYSTVEDNSMIHTRIALDTSSTGYQAAVEEAVYDNPLLVDGRFDSVTCLTATGRYAVVPTAATADRAESLAQSIFGQPATPSDYLTDDIGDPRQCILHAQDTKLTAFLLRTFTNPTIEHRLSPLIRYFRLQSRMGNSGKMYVHFTGRQADIIVYWRDTVRFVNTFTCREPADALYYIMSVRKLCRLSSENDELVLAGDAAMRKAVTPLLRRYVASVLPAIFPSALYRAGREAMNAPFNIVILPLSR